MSARVASYVNIKCWIGYLFYFSPYFSSLKRIKILVLKNAYLESHEFLTENWFFFSLSYVQQITNFANPFGLINHKPKSFCAWSPNPQKNQMHSWSSPSLISRKKKVLKVPIIFILLSGFQRSNRLTFCQTEERRRQRKNERFLSLVGSVSWWITCRCKHIT